MKIKTHARELCMYAAGPLFEGYLHLPTIAAAPLIQSIIYKYKHAASPLFEGYLHFT